MGGEKLLGDDEQVVATMRTHWKALVMPVVLCAFVIAIGIFLAMIAPEGDYQSWLRLAILIVAVVLIAGGTLWPILTWATATYTLTNRRLITRRGVITRTGRDIPLTRINDVSTERGLLDRIFGCGTLVIESAGQRGRIVLHDVPHVESVHLRMSELLFGSDTDTDTDSGSGPDGARAR